MPHSHPKAAYTPSPAKEDRDDPYPSSATSAQEAQPAGESNPATRDDAPPSHNHQTGIEKGGLLSWLTSGFKMRPENLRDVIEEYIEESQDGDNPEDSGITSEEKLLISNILKLRNIQAADAMIPSADIMAIEVDTPADELLDKLASSQFSRFPVYKERLDDILGTIHIKDVLYVLAKGGQINIREMIRDVPIIAPSMNALNLLMQMRETRKHMAMVVDEFGGIDGLVTIGDLIEEIVGQMEDEHDSDTHPRLIDKPDGTVLADGRVDTDDFEARYGAILTAEEREENDTLGGLVIYLAGRVPVRGEIIPHSSGLTFEIIEADLRRIKRLRLRNIAPAYNI